MRSCFVDERGGLRRARYKHRAMCRHPDGVRLCFVLPSVNLRFSEEDGQLACTEGLWEPRVRIAHFRYLIAMGLDVHRAVRDL